MKLKQVLNEMFDTDIEDMTIKGLGCIIGARSPRAPHSGCGQSAAAHK